jgi:hypothetical protein
MTLIGATMEPPLIYVFDDFETAERAHDELLSCGFDRAAVQLTVRDDEAGPAQGNFITGDAPSVAGGQDYKKTYANPVHRGGCMLTITPVDPTQAKYALALLARYGISDATAAPAAAAQPRPSA